MMMLMDEEQKFFSISIALGPTVYFPTRGIYLVGQKSMYLQFFSSYASW